jgi:hypothetical protein
MRVQGKAIETKVQVLNADGSPATGATVNYIIRDYNDEEWQTGVMTHIANGIFTTPAWEPNGGSGTWTVECFSGDPIFRQTFSYYVPSYYSSPNNSEGIEIPVDHSGQYAAHFEVSCTPVELFRIVGPYSNGGHYLLVDMRACSTMKRFVIKLDHMFWNDGGRTAKVMIWPDDFDVGCECVVIEIPPCNYRTYIWVESDVPEAEQVHLYCTLVAKQHPIQLEPNCDEQAPPD